jgi:hypothetical protein
MQLGLVNMLGLCTIYAGRINPEQAHARARATADTGRFLPGTDAFKNALIKC